MSNNFPFAAILDSKTVISKYQRTRPADDQASDEYRNTILLTCGFLTASRTCLTHHFHRISMTSRISKRHLLPVRSSEWSRTGQSSRVTVQRREEGNEGSHGLINSVAGRSQCSDCAITKLRGMERLERVYLPALLIASSNNRRSKHGILVVC